MSCHGSNEKMASFEVETNFLPQGESDNLSRDV